MSLATSDLAGTVAARVATEARGHYHMVAAKVDWNKLPSRRALGQDSFGFEKAMSIGDCHTIKLHFADSQSISLESVIEATGLLVNAFVEGDELHDQTYVHSIESVSNQVFVIRSTPRHPLEESRLALERAFAPLYLIFAAWFLAGANVEIEGRWKDSFPGRGALDHESPPLLLLRPIFQDEIPASERAVYPSLDTLAEIHRMLLHSGDWDQIQASPAFRECFPLVSPNPKAPNNIRLSHRTGFKVDLIVKLGMISSHILDSVQPEIDPRFVSCDRETLYARSWWDAWIGHCPSNSLAPKHVMLLPNEVGVLSLSGSIWRYQLEDKTTLERYLEVDFGDGVHPTRPIESWLQSASHFGEAGFVEVAIACCEQALASATAMISNAPGLALKLPLGMSARQQLQEAETEYLRWLDHKESLDKPTLLHVRWGDGVHCRGLHELTIRVGSQWAAALEELVEAINREHYESHDYHRRIGHVPEFFWNADGKFGTLKYDRLFGRKLMDAKVPKKSVALLGYEFSEEGIPSYVEFADIFTLTLGNAIFWGSVEKRVVVSCSEPNQAYLL